MPGAHATSPTPPAASRTSRAPAHGQHPAPAMSGAYTSAQKRQRAASARMRPSVVAARQIFPEAVGEESSAKHRAAASAVSRAALSALSRDGARGQRARLALTRCAACPQFTRMLWSIDYDASLRQLLTQPAATAALNKWFAQVDP